MNAHACHRCLSSLYRSRYTHQLILALLRLLIRDTNALIQFLLPLLQHFGVYRGAKVLEDILSPAAASALGTQQRRLRGESVVSLTLSCTGDEAIALPLPPFGKFSPNWSIPCA